VASKVVVYFYGYISSPYRIVVFELFEELMHRIMKDCLKLEYLNSFKRYEL